MQRIILDTNPSQRYEDANGFLCIKHNPIAKAGVFEYLGENLGMTGNDAKRIYKVYRPFEELVKTAKEFEGIPITLDHHWVEGDNTNPTIMGIISGRVTAEEPYLYADIRIINDEARRAIESGEMRELSPGYTSQFIEEAGIYNNEEYSFKQFDMHYNHLALVDVGRSGPDLKILDANNTEKLQDSLEPEINSVLNKIKRSATNLSNSIKRSSDTELSKEAYLYTDEIDNLYDYLQDYLNNESYAHQAEMIIDNMSTMLNSWSKDDFNNDKKVLNEARSLIRDLAELKNKAKKLKIFDKAGGKQMPKILKIEDVNIDKLTALLTDFFNEEKEEGVHNDIPTDDEGDDVLIDMPTDDEGDFDIPTDDEGDDVLIDMPTDDEGDDVFVDMPTDDEGDDVLIDIPTDDEGDFDIPTDDEGDFDIPTDDEGDEETIKEVASKTVDSAIKLYKREHAKMLAAYDEVTPLVGHFKTYDKAGNILTEESVYKVACSRLGLKDINGISSYKSAFKAANFMHQKLSKNTHKSEDAGREIQDATVDALIKNAFRN